MIHLDNSILQRWTHDHPKDLASYAQCDRFQWPQSWELEVEGQCFKICGDFLVAQLFESWSAPLTHTYCVHLAVKPVDIAAEFTFFFLRRSRYSFDPQRILLMNEEKWNIMKYLHFGFSFRCCYTRNPTKKIPCHRKTIIHSWTHLSGSFHTPSLGGMLLAAIKCATVPATPQHAPPKASCRKLVVTEKDIRFTLTKKGQGYEWRHTRYKKCNKKYNMTVEVDPDCESMWELLACINFFVTSLHR